MMRPPTRRRARGFTLVEMMAAIVVLGIIGSIASNLVLNAADDYVSAATRGQLHLEASSSLDRIARELRNIPLDGTGVKPDIDDVTATSIDWNDAGGDAYSLTLTGTNLYLAVDGGTAQVLLSDVSAFSVSAFDESDTALAATLTGAGCDPIRRLAVSITLLRYGVSETLSAKWFLRSTMSGGG